MFGQSLLSAFGSAACTTDTDQLFTTDVQTTSVATYQFNNATTSIPSNTYPGTPSNITYAAGKFGNAAVFNGSSSYIDLGNNLGLANNSFSFSCWIKNIGTGSNSWVFAAEGSGSTNQKLHIGRDAGNGKFYIDFWGNGLYSTSQVTTNSIWQNWVITFDSTTKSRKIYLNGSLDNSDTSSSNYLGTGDINIGQLPSYNQWLQGTLDQVRIFNTALSQAAVTALYNETTTTATYDYVEYEGANPNSIAYYKMSNATDQLGNYNGTATNVNFNTEGKFGFAGAFNGSSSTFFLASAGTSVTNYDSDFSVSMWFNVSSWASAASSDFLWTGGGTRIVNIHLTGSYGLAFDLWNSGSNIVSTTGLSENVWYNLVITRSKTAGMVLYINGASVDTNSFTGNASSLSSQDSLGTYWNNTRNNFTGKIDQVRIYDSALSAANVTTLYNEIECPAVAVTNAFNTVLYTGNATARSITNLGFAPDFTWTKSRNAVNRHQLFDSVRGATKAIESDETFAESTEPTALTSFDTDGFSLGNSGNVNSSGTTYVAWNWKAGGTAVSNTDGTITSQVSANVDAGFSIVKYTGNENANQTVGHGLSQTPEIVFTKQLDGTREWTVPLLSGFSTGNYLVLNDANALADDNNRWSSISSSTITIGASPFTNGSGSPYISYFFHSVAGYSKVGSYVGNGSTTGPIVYVGFEPTWLLRKNVTSSTDAHWSIIDNKRNVTTPMNPRFERLLANLANAENTTDINHKCDFNSTSFQPLSNHNITNASGQTYIFLAIA